MKGAPGHIFNILARRAASGGECAISYLALAAESEYSIPTVAAAIQRLAADGLIEVVQRGHGRRNVYRIVCQEYDGYRWVA